LVNLACFTLLRFTHRSEEIEQLILPSTPSATGWTASGVALNLHEGASMRADFRLIWKNWDDRRPLEPAGECGRAGTRIRSTS